MASNFRKAKKARKHCILMLLCLVLQMIFVQIVDYWQTGNCTQTNCYWKEGIPWRTDDARHPFAHWIAVLIFGALAIILLFISFLMLVIEMWCLKRLQDNHLYNLILWILGIFSLACWFLHVLLYIVNSLPLRGNLSFSFGSAVLSFLLLIVFCVTYFFSNKWRRQADNDNAEQDKPPQPSPPYQQQLPDEPDNTYDY